MSHSWTKDHPTASSLLDAPSHVREQARLLGHANGGLTRVNLPEEVINRGMLTPAALHRVYLNTPISLKSSYYVSAGAQIFKGADFENYRGEWINQDFSLTGVLEGMLHVEFSTWSWHNTKQTLDSPKRTMWRVAVDGLVVATSAEHWCGWMNPFLSAAVPHPGGTAVVTVGVQYMPPKGNPTTFVDEPDVDQLYHDGGTLLVIGRWR